MLHRHCCEGSGRSYARLLSVCVGLLWIAAPVSPAAASSAPAEEKEKPKTRQQMIADWRIACATGDGSACYILGDAYETRRDLWGRQIKGDGVHRDDEQALRYFRLACEHGYGKGCSSLGRLYEIGKGARKNQEESERAFGRACALMGGDACDHTDAAPLPTAPKLRS
ncbi:tetratricopeptide repeat protein [Hyphococcus sp.]|uniref:tetratricopeptide repeat protein n=1 Tax=Hyphococcus sp. TaxID=2038636 RepID=UPI0035C72910